MSYELNHQDLVKLVMGHTCIDPRNKELWRKYEQFTRFTGNQWNENWDWIKEKLDQLSDSDLWEMHQTLR